MTGGTTELPSLTLAVITKQYLVWFGLHSIFERSETMRIVLREHQQITPNLLSLEPRPDVFLLDLQTNRDAIDLIRQIRESAPTSKIVLLSGVEKWHRLHEACAYGVDGVILTIQPPEVVRAVIETLYPGTPRQAQIDDSRSVRGNQAAIPQQRVNPAAHQPMLGDGLTQREREVIELVQQGLSNKEIACKLFISDNTVRHHLSSIFDKVNVPNRKQLMAHNNHQFHSTHA